MPVAVPNGFKPINPAKKNYASVSAAVNKYARKNTYKAVVAAMGGAASIVTAILAAVTTSWSITVQQVMLIMQQSMVMMQSLIPAQTQFLSNVLGELV